MWTSFTAPHWPLQVPENWLDKYKGDYKEGYEVLRRKRFENLKKIGLINPSTDLPPPMQNIRPWDDLNDEDKKRETRKMQLYASMVENADYHIGRIIKTLKENGQYDNTIILVLSDNGASPTDFYNHRRGDYCRKHHDNSFDNMGKEGSWVAHGAGWANALMGPLYGYKRWTSEGGISVPFIISGGLAIGSGMIKHDILNIEDLAPTFLELGKVEYPEKYKGKKVRPMRGKSFAGLMLLRSETGPHSNNTVFACEQRNHAYLRKGDFKIVTYDQANIDRFELYNLKNDPFERNDIAKEETQKFEEMLDEWRQFKEDVGMKLPK